MPLLYFDRSIAPGPKLLPLQSATGYLKNVGHGVHSIPVRHGKQPLSTKKNLPTTAL